MLKLILSIVVLAALAVLIYTATRPDRFKIFLLIDDLYSWAIWSPYEKLDAERVT